MSAEGSPALFTRGQRSLALVFGLACHLAFAVAVTVMALALFSGMTFGRGPFGGLYAWLANGLLLLSFPLLHSWFLSDRGRRWVARHTPGGLGRELFSTVFVLLTALQLILLFGLWSPSGVVLWRAEGVAYGLVAAGAGAAWILLLVAMGQAQLGLQTGFLGWSAVVRNRRPVYKGLPSQGLYAHVRQPIYIAFALILWMASVWTPDQLVLAGMLTGYCLAGSAIKERRYQRYYGDVFRRYQALVPFWIPSLRRAYEKPAGEAPDVALDKEVKPDYEVIIIGGGPVGLLLAVALGQRGRQVLVVERCREASRQSMAIGITPPSLDILKALGLDARFVSEGVRIEHATVTADRRSLGGLDFSTLASEHRYILSLPQAETVQILRERLAALPCVRVLDGLEFTHAVQAGDRVLLQLRDVCSGVASRMTARFLVGCDGVRGTVRRAAGIPIRRKTYRPRFVMADMVDHTGWGAEARLFFTAGGSVESFPLPGGLRRWVVLARRWQPADPVAAYIVQRVRALTGYDLDGTACRFESSFRPGWGLARRYGVGRMALCGDAAHQMSPIGGQGMNTGFGDAAMLVEVLDAGLAGVPDLEACWAVYTRERSRAFRRAARRAAGGMWLGTRTGRVASLLRRLFIAHCLFHPAIKNKLAPYFAMLTLPAVPAGGPVLPVLPVLRRAS